MQSHKSPSHRQCEQAEHKDSDGYCYEFVDHQKVELPRGSDLQLGKAHQAHRDDGAIQREDDQQCLDCLQLNICIADRRTQIREPTIDTHQNLNGTTQISSLIERSDKDDYGCQNATHIVDARAHCRNVIVHKVTN